jgi:hypothetical protein
MKSGELKEAGQVISELIVSKVAPRTFWSTLFDNALELLDPINGEVLSMCLVEKIVKCVF